MKTGSIEINGTTYTLALTKSAFDALSAMTGGAENFASLFSAKNIEESYTETLKMLSALLDGGRKYAALVFEREEKKLTLEDLEVILSPGDCMNYRLKAVETIALGLQREVEVETERKNADTMQMDP